MAENTAATAEGTSGANAVTDADNQQGQEKTYSEKDFQSEVDKRVTAALKTAQTKWQSEYDEKLKSERDEAARLAKMTADERAKAEFDKRVKEFEDKEAKHNAERLTFECTKQLAAEGLSVEMAQILTGADAETTKANIETFKKIFGEALEKAVDERLKGKPPKQTAGTADGAGGEFADIIKQNQRI